MTSRGGAGVPQLGTNANDYSNCYYASHLGGEEEYSWDSPSWQAFFISVSEQIIAITGPARVLDVGAGTGNSTKALLDRGFSVVSLEQNGAMIDTMRDRRFDPHKHKVVKASAEQLNDLRSIPDQSFDAVTLVNVLYSLDDPFACLTGVNRVLKSHGVVGLSTTHAGVTLEPLLTSIKNYLNGIGFDAYEDDYARLAEVNRRIEQTIACRHKADEYRNMVQDAGFEIISSLDFTYEGAVMLIHARKKR